MGNILNNKMLNYNLQLFGGRGASSGLKGTGGGGKASAEEQEALEWYVSGDGMWINNALRGRNPDIQLSDLTEDEKAMVASLDRLTGEEVGEQTLFRTVDASAVFGGITEDEYYAMQNVIVNKSTEKYYQKDYQNGINKLVNSFTEKGFMSTTKDAKIASDNAYFFGSEKPIILEVKTSKKTKGVDVMKHANKMMKEVEAAEPQKEVLLGRNQKWKTSNKISSINGFIKVTINM